MIVIWLWSEGKKISSTLALTTTTTTTTTKKPKRKRKKKKPKWDNAKPITYQNLAPNLLIDGILPPEPPNRPPGPSLASRLENNMITKRIGQLQAQSNMISHVVPAPSGRRFQNNGNWRMRRRLRNPNNGLRFQSNNNRISDPYTTGNRQVNSFYGGRR